ncbi:ATPase, partial [Campylobacter mucosalis]
KLEKLFSKERLDSYKDEAEHIRNFATIDKIASKVGMLEIITRNAVARELNISDDKFISQQTLGFWVTMIDIMKIHNKILPNIDIDFKRYSKFNLQKNLLNHEKIKILYSLLRTIRNRAFHFENLLKLNANNRPRLSCALQRKDYKLIVGIDPDNIELFLDDFLDLFGKDLRFYLK